MPEQPHCYLNAIKDALNAIESHEHLTVSDQLAIVAIKQAIMAAEMNNYPVGAIIVNKQGDILQANHNHVFHPYFNSMAHAEMMTLNAFEQKNPTINYNDLSLITSLEPCIMCYSRLLLSKIPTIYYVAKDWRHGAMEFSKQFPESYDIFKQHKTFQQLDCVPALQKIAGDVFFNHKGWEEGNYHNHQ